MKPEMMTQLNDTIGSLTNDVQTLIQMFDIITSIESVGTLIPSQSLISHMIVPRFHRQGAPRLRGLFPLKLTKGNLYIRLVIPYYDI